MRFVGQLPAGRPAGVLLAALAARGLEAVLRQDELWLLDEDRLPEAACVYEEILRIGNGKEKAETYLNLALVYLSAMDPALSAHAGLSRDFQAFAGRRFREVLEETLKRWPRSVEAWFWLRYADRLYHDGECFLRECEDRLSESDDIVPYAYLALARGERPYSQQIRALRVLSRVQLTARMRYIQRMIG